MFKRKYSRSKTNDKMPVQEDKIPSWLKEWCKDFDLNAKNDKQVAKMLDTYQYAKYVKEKKGSQNERAARMQEELMKVNVDLDFFYRHVVEHPEYEKY